MLELVVVVTEPELVDFATVVVGAPKTDPRDALVPAKPRPTPIPTITILVTPSPSPSATK